MAKGKHKKKSHAIYKAEGRREANKKRNVARCLKKAEKDAAKRDRVIAQRLERKRLEAEAV